MSDTLTIRSPEGRVIVEFICDVDAIADRAIQLQTTGEETSELHLFVMSIIEGDIAVQDGISIGALQDMALTVGAGLGPLGEYFCELATSTWTYADACRIAGDLTKFMPDRLSNLKNSLATLVTEREHAEGWLYQAQGLDEDEKMSGGGYLIPYSVLGEEGDLNTPSFAVMLDGMEKEKAVSRIETHLGSVQTLHEAVHDRNDEMLVKFDTAVSEWEAAADLYIESLDGILGTLADTDAENEYQNLGTAAEVASWVGAAADGVTVFIPVPPVVAIGMAANAVEVGLSKEQVSRAHEAQYQPGEGSIRVVEGQHVGEQGDVAVAASGFIPMGDLAKKAYRGVHNKNLRDSWADVVDAAAGSTTNAPTASRRDREADVPVDVGVSTDPIESWRDEADASNPEHEYVPNRPMPESGELHESQPVQIPTVESDPSTGETGAAPKPTVTVDDTDDAD
ncbi:hypothetical protein [Ruania alba]|uniref:Uncharacterized protein n=1 Tax=Ruania alba TaxID=648782 RepID=A0A1H5M1W3_9MICO|nr:hypothetical protein [Ruania alba]SEE83252.1 hypothetical protein SAMN04488554_3102 [Ruania alba]